MCQDASQPQLRLRFVAPSRRPRRLVLKSGQWKSTPKLAASKSFPSMIMRHRRQMTSTLGWQSMVRVTLKGINSITKKLADGTTRTYWYAWKGGPSLRGKPGTPEFIASYNEAVARKVAPPRGKCYRAATISGERRLHRARRQHPPQLCRIDRAHRESVRGFPAGGAHRPAHSRYLQGMAGSDRHRLRSPTGRLCLDRARPCLVMGPGSRACRGQSM